MDSFFENGFARMYGPLFLVFYAVLSCIVILFVKYVAPNITGKVKDSDGSILPQQPDPYEIAYIRGGEMAVLFLTIYNLVKRGHFVLRVNDDKTKVYIDRKIKNVPKETLNALEIPVFDSISNEWRLKDFITHVKRNQKFKKQSELLGKKLEEEKFIWSTREKKIFATIQFTTCMFLLLVGIYKLLAAIVHGHSNIAFLLVMMSAPPFFIFSIKIDSLPTSKGKKRLDQLKSTFRFIQGNKLQEQPLYIQQILVATHGFILLQYSNFAFLYEYFFNLLDPFSDLNYDPRSPTRTGNPFAAGAASCGGGCSGGGGCGGGGCGGCGGCS